MGLERSTVNDIAKRLTFPFKINDNSKNFLYPSSWIAEQADPGAVMTYVVSNARRKLYQLGKIVSFLVFLQGDVHHGAKIVVLKIIPITQLGL